ncbi:hypothetical protein C8R45DRAFT_928997 [Mycena sanguinolenta]|nr:hypothetical protein C8R45DRAFT_928997 [Mycena sanguinolenta]
MALPKSLQIFRSDVWTYVQQPLPYRILTGLQLSIIAVTAGLTASILLLLLSLPHSLLSGGPTSDDDDIQIDGIGLLHAIWLYRNHSELETLLKQVDQPTADNLPSAGEVRIRLVATRKKSSSLGLPFDTDSWEERKVEDQV